MISSTGTNPSTSRKEHYIRPNRSNQPKRPVLTMFHLPPYDLCRMLIFYFSFVPQIHEPMTDLSLNWRATSDYSVRVVSRTTKTKQQNASRQPTPRNTSPLVLIRCDGSHEATLLSPGSHTFRRCKQGLYKQNISRKVHTLLVVDENGNVML